MSQETSQKSPSGGPSSPSVSDQSRITFYLPDLPPSVNRLYVPNGFGGKRLSTAGKAWRARALLDLTKQCMFASAGVLDTEKAYVLELTFLFEPLINKGWPKTAKTRFRKKDASNYVKLLEDCVSCATGVDDSNTVMQVVAKEEYAPGRFKDDARIRIVYGPIGGYDEV
jgi:Holliday junction resolvase RusA-like endonuclease